MDAFKLNFAAAVAVMQTIAEFYKETNKSVENEIGIKWPNDIWTKKK